MVNLLSGGKLTLWQIPFRISAALAIDLIIEILIQ